MKKIALIGNSFALLVVALELANKNFEILIFNDSKNLGGHFSGIEIQGHKFNFGMVMFEGLDNLRCEEDFTTYNPKVRNDWLRFGATVSEWIKNNVQVKRASTPQCLIDGVIYPDYLIADKLDAFKARAHLFCDGNLSMSNEMHPSLKAKSELYEVLSYGDVANLCHGEKFHHHYIEPFVKKLLMVSSKDFLARYHRSAWVPLFYPETINDLIHGIDVSLGEYNFWTTQDGFAGRLVENILKKLELYQNIKFFNKPIDYLTHVEAGWDITVAGNIYQASSLILGTSIERANELLCINKSLSTDTTSVAVLFALVRHSEIKKSYGCLLLVDESYASYRFTDQDAISDNVADWHRVTLEANPKYIMEKYGSDDIEKFMVSELRDLMGLSTESSIRVLKTIVAKNSLTYPTQNSVNSINQSVSILVESAPDVFLTSGLLGFGVSSLNDQIVQGLKISQELQ